MKRFWLLLLILVMATPLWGAMATTTYYGFPKPALGDSGAAKKAEYDTKMDAADAALYNGFVGKISLQSSTPGAQQTGNLNVSGTIKGGLANITSTYSGIPTFYGITGAFSVSHPSASIWPAAGLNITITGTGSYWGSTEIAGIASSSGYSQAGTVLQIASGVASWLTPTDGTINYGYGVKIGTPQGSGVITNNYGLYIFDQSDFGTTQTFNLYSAGATAKNYFAGKVGVGKAVPNSAMAVAGLPVYANNADALAGGLTAGDFYRDGGDPDHVCVVH